MNSHSTKTVHGRIRKLEIRYSAAIAARQKDDSTSGAAKIAEWLARFGIAPGPNESLAETTARALGITCRELQTELQRRAAGITSGRWLSA